MAVFDILLSRVLFFILLQHIGALVPSWREFKSSVTVEIRILHSHPLTNCCFPSRLVWNWRPSRGCSISPTNLCVARWDFQHDGATRHEHVGHKSCCGHFSGNSWIIHRIAEATLLGGRRFYDNEEVVIAFHEWLRMQDADF